MLLCGAGWHPPLAGPTDATVGRFAFVHSCASPGACAPSADGEPSTADSPQAVPFQSFISELNRYAVRRQRRHSCLPARCAIAGGGLMTRPVGVGQVGNLRTDCQSVPPGASPAGCRHVETPPNLSLATPPIREAWPSFCAIIMPMRAAQPTKRRMVRLAPKHFQGDLINTQKAIAPPNPISPFPCRQRQALPDAVWGPETPGTFHPFHPCTAV